ncbi:hypothetical protein [Vitreimonas flagellata]|uniref:hypothetical protein n=1 Tax=Vitreimonas flagellata TaxID=2560861 RepID=UPI001074E570|nr:hypothetical protein [Vitreimonas flagellata]
MISAHGWFLVDAACPDRTIDWRNTDELRAKEYYHELESVAWATLFDSSGPPQDLLVEFTGVLRWQPQMSRLRVDVHGVDAFAVAAAALPYVDERGDLSAEPPE